MSEIMNFLPWTFFLTKSKAKRHLHWAFQQSVASFKHLMSDSAESIQVCLKFCFPEGDKVFVCNLESNGLYRRAWLSFNLTKLKISHLG